MSKTFTFAIEEVLTVFARGYVQDMARSLAHFFAPVVGTGVASGQYKEFTHKNAFTVPETGRAIGGDATRLSFETEDNYYNCTPHALEAVIDEHEKRLLPEANLQTLKESRIAALLSTAKLAREKEVITKARGAVGATSGKGNWTADDVDPIAELDELIEDIAKTTGIFPNRMVLGISAFAKLRKNAVVRADLTGDGGRRMTLDKLREMLIIPDIDIRLGTLVYDTAKVGRASNLEFLLGNDVFLFIGEDQPTPYDPSFMKTFATDASLIDGVRSYEEGPRRDVYATDWTQDVRATSPLSARRLVVS